MDRNRRSRSPEYALIEYAGPIGAHAWRTYWVTMAGFGIAVAVGLALGFMIGSSPTLYAAAYPLMTAFNALPKAAFVLFAVVEKRTTAWAHRGGGAWQLQNTWPCRGPLCVCTNDPLRSKLAGLETPGAGKS